MPETDLSTTADNIILLKYLELEGQLRRALTILKSRGYDHDRRVREVLIDINGIDIGNPFTQLKNMMGDIVTSPNEKNEWAN